MSANSSLELEYTGITDRWLKPSGMALLRAFLATGWSLDNGVGGISFYPPHAEAGDVDNLPLAEAETVLAQLALRESTDPFLYFSLTWKRTGQGGYCFLYPAERKLHIGLDTIDRQLGHGTRIADTTWYLRRLFPAFASLDLNICSVRYDYN